MINSNYYVDKLLKLPRPDRRKVENLIREIYNNGVQEQKKRVSNYLKRNGYVYQEGRSDEQRKKIDNQLIKK